MLNYNTVMVQCLRVMVDDMGLTKIPPAGSPELPVMLQSLQARVTELLESALPTERISRGRLTIHDPVAQQAMGHTLGATENVVGARTRAAAIADERASGSTEAPGPTIGTMLQEAASRAGPPAKAKAKEPAAAAVGKAKPKAKSTAKPSAPLAPVHPWTLPPSRTWSGSSWPSGSSGSGTYWGGGWWS